MSEDVAIAQIVTAVTTVFYAAVFANGYYLLIRGNRKTLREMREERLSGGRPQVIVEMGLLNLPIVEFVVRNVSGGAARDITFELSGPIEDSSGFVISELRYLKDGIPFLGPGEKVRCLWNHIDRLVPYLEAKRLYEGLPQDSSSFLPQEIPADARKDKASGSTKDVRNEDTHRNP